MAEHEGTEESTPKISVVIVSWNVRELLQRNLARLFSLSCRYPFEVFVVDNASHDGSAQTVRAEFPHVRLIVNDRNAGFARANNQALRLARGETIILLNPDMRVDEGALEAAHDQLTTDKSIGVLGIRLTDDSGRPIGSVRRFPDFVSQLVVILKLGHLFPKLLAHYLYADFDYGVSQDVDQVRGSFFAFRRELLDTVGYLDDGFFVWFEEVDYCLRVKAAGLRVRYFAGATARDFVGRSAAQMTHFEKQRIFTASMIRYFDKHQPRWQGIVLRIARPFGLAMALGADGWKKLNAARK
jgi:GT2 family glycosyltransferase